MSEIYSSLSYKYFGFLVVCKISDKILMDSNFHSMVPGLVICTVERKSVFRGVCDTVIYQLDRKNTDEIMVKIEGERIDPRYAYLEIVIGENTTRIGEMIMCSLC